MTGIKDETEAVERECFSLINKLVKALEEKNVPDDAIVEIIKKITE